MCAAPVSPVPIVSTGALATATILWQWRGRHYVTALAKATFTMAPDRVMVASRPEPIDTTLELAPFRSELDVVLVAAHAHAAAPAEVAAVRLVLSGSDVLIDKGLLVYAPRPGGVVAPFRCAAIVARQGRPDALVVNPADPRERGTLGPRDVAAKAHHSGGVLLVDDDVDWSAFQRAPADQRVGSLNGDEWLVLEGLTAERALFRSRLPGAAVETRVYPPSLWCGKSLRLAMRPDQLLVDADRLTCSLLWRGAFTVQSVAVARSLTLVSALRLPGGKEAWPSAPQVATSAALQTHRAHLAGAGVTAPGDQRVVTPLEQDMSLAQGAATVPEAEEAYQLAFFAGVVLLERVEARAPAITETGTLDLPPDKTELAPPDAGLLDLAPADGAPWGSVAAAQRAASGTLIAEPYDDPPELPPRDVSALEATLSDTLDEIDDPSRLPVKG
jgi:hypothetical protein